MARLRTKPGMLLRCKRNWTTTSVLDGKVYNLFPGDIALFLERLPHPHYMSAKVFKLLRGKEITFVSIFWEYRVSDIFEKAIK